MYNDNGEEEGFKPNASGYLHCPCLLVKQRSSKMLLTVSLFSTLTLGFFVDFAPEWILSI